MNGFRYIRESLLRYHNFKICTVAEKLTDNNIKIYSVKTDAFIIEKSDIDAAKNFLRCSSDTGGWRVSSSEGNDIQLPTHQLNMHVNVEITLKKTTHKLTI